MCARRIADHADALGIEAELARLGADELDRGLAIEDVSGPARRAGLHQPVVDREHGIAVAGEMAAPTFVKFAVAGLPAAAMDPDQHRHPVQSGWPIEIAKQWHPVRFGEHDVRLHVDLELCHLITPSPKALLIGSL